MSLSREFLRFGPSLFSSLTLESGYESKLNHHIQMIKLQIIRQKKKKCIFTNDLEDIHFFHFNPSHLFLKV